MKKILVTGTAAVIAALAMASFSAPASAKHLNVTIGLGGYGYGPGYGGWNPGYGGGIYVDPYPMGNWQAHVDWCFDHKGPSYNPNTNKYINNYGKWRTCHSPFA